jgi:hypothetical protein
MLQPSKKKIFEREKLFQLQKQSWLSVLERPVRSWRMLLERLTLCVGGWQEGEVLVGCMD